MAPTRHPGRGFSYCMVFVKVQHLFSVYLCIVYTEREASAGAASCLMRLHDILCVICDMLTQDTLDVIIKV